MYGTIFLNLKILRKRSKCFVIIIPALLVISDPKKFVCTQNFYVRLPYDLKFKIIKYTRGPVAREETGFSGEVTPGIFGSFGVF